MREADQPAPQLDGLVDDVASGRQALLFPPGISAFLVANVCLLVGNGLLVGVIAVGFLPRGTIGSSPAGAVVGLIGVVVTTLLVAAAAFLTVRGYPQGHRTFQYLAAAVALLALVNLLASAVGASTLGPGPCALPLVPLALANLALQSKRYHAYAEFMRRVRTRRVAIAAKRQAARNRIGGP